MKAILFTAIFALIPSISLACTLDQAVFDKTRARFVKLDVNSDGKLEKEEFMQQKKKAAKLEKEWEAERLAQKGYITKDEFVRREHPKCIEVKK